MNELHDAVLIRDNFTCVLCGQTEGKIQTDHIKPFSLYPELRLDINNGQTLCQSCHAIKNSQDMRLIRKEASHLWKKCLTE